MENQKYTRLYFPNISDGIDLALPILTGFKKWLVEQILHCEVQSFVPDDLPRAVNSEVYHGLKDYLARSKFDVDDSPYVQLESRVGAVLNRFR